MIIAAIGGNKSANYVKVYCQLYTHFGRLITVDFDVVMQILTDDWKRWTTVRSQGLDLSPASHL